MRDWVLMLCGMLVAAAFVVFRDHVWRKRPNWKHRKSGDYYRVLYENNAFYEATKDPVVVYQGADGIVWVRSKPLFFDGRFLPLWVGDMHKVTL